MKIGEIAKIVGLTTKSIRFYESIHLINSPHRDTNGYRSYTDADIQVLTLIKRARSLGCSIDECQSLVELWRFPDRKSEQVNRVLVQKIANIAEQIASLKEMKAILNELVQKCPNDQESYCPILTKLTR